MLGCAVQKNEGHEGVGQWGDFEEGAGFQLGPEGWIIKLTRRETGIFSQHICRGTKDLLS